MSCLCARRYTNMTKDACDIKVREGLPRAASGWDQPFVKWLTQSLHDESC